MFLRTPVLRLVLAAILPFLMAANVFAMPITPGVAEQGVSMPMMDMSGCDEGADSRLAVKCAIDCPLICGAIAPSGPVTVLPLSRPLPPGLPILSTAGNGISIRPDYPPPR